MLTEEDEAAEPLEAEPVRVKVGHRPSAFTPALAEEICEAIATSSHSLDWHCSQHPNWPTARAVYKWLASSDPRYAGFVQQYARAKERQADLLADEILAISDDASRDYTVTEDGRSALDAEHVQRSRLRVDSRKWLAGKLAPQKYGDKIEATIKRAPLDDDELDKRIRQLATAVGVEIGDALGIGRIAGVEEGPDRAN